MTDGKSSQTEIKDNSFLPSGAKFLGAILRMNLSSLIEIPHKKLVKVVVQILRSFLEDTDSLHPA